MQLQVLNGATGRIQGAAGNTYTLNGSSRIQGATGRIQGFDSEELKEYYLSRAMGDISMNAPINGLQGKLKDRIKNRKARRQEKKAGRQMRKEEKRSLRDRRRIARTEAMERGEGFFQKAAGALSNFGEAAKIRATAETMAADEGVPLDFSIEDVRSMAAGAGDVMDDSTGQPGFFEKNKTAIFVGGGLFLLTVLYFIFKPKQKAKARRR